MTGKPRYRTRQAAGGPSKAPAVPAPTATDDQGELGGRPSDLLSPPPGGTFPDAGDSRHNTGRATSPTFSQDSRDEDERAAQNALKSPSPGPANNASPDPQYPGGYAPSLGNPNPYADYQPDQDLANFVDQRNNPESSDTRGHGNPSLKPPIILETNMESGKRRPLNSRHTTVEPQR